MKKKIFDYEDEDAMQDFVPAPEWEINADINPDLKQEGLDLLAKGIKARKVAIHLGITIDKIKRL